MNTSYQRELPEKGRIGYANWGQCDEGIFQAVQNGCNVIIWFSVNLVTNKETHLPEIRGGPDYKEVAKMVDKIYTSGYKVIHLISIGGWNSPHPDTAHSASEYFEAFTKWNALICNPELHFNGFDGIDWDIEGNDDMSSQYNEFTIKELDLMGTFSKGLKENGYFVSMAPAESYLDPTTNEFSGSLKFNYPEWEKEFPNFTYHGRNTYAYLIAKYGIELFDFVSVQLYEGYSHALFKYTRKQMKFGEIINDGVFKLSEGYEVDFSKVQETEMGKVIIKVPQDKIAIGLANAWAHNQFLFVKEEDIITGYNYLVNQDNSIRGLMFWDIKDEGLKDYYMSKIMKKVFPYHY